jgi:N-acetylglucosaminyl-diphospho-decaprenol L-rhamnosyltransferase
MSSPDDPTSLDDESKDSSSLPVAIVPPSSPHQPLLPSIPYLRPTTLDIIIVTYQTGDSLWETLDSCQSDPLVSRIWIVNNGNPHKTLVRLYKRAALDQRIQLLNPKTNIGFARACNFAALFSRADFLLFLNPDCYLHNNATQAFLEAFREKPDAWMIGPRILSPDGTEQRGSRRNLITPFNSLLEIGNIWRFLPKKWQKYRIHLHDNPAPKNIEPVPAISGAAMCIRREYFEQLRGFNVAYFLHMEDMDLCLRIKKSGGIIYTTPHIEVVHHGATSDISEETILDYKLSSFRHYFKTYFKWRPGFLWYLFSGLLYVRAAWLKALIRRRRSLVVFPPSS